MRMMGGGGDRIGVKKREDSIGQWVRKGMGI